MGYHIDVFPEQKEEEYIQMLYSVKIRSDVNINYHCIAILRCAVRVAVAVVIRSTSRTKARQSSQTAFGQRHLPDVLATSAPFDCHCQFCRQTNLVFNSFNYFFQRHVLECIFFCVSFFDRTNELKMLEMQYV